MKNKSLTPQIRFKGFEDEWNKLPLIDSFTLIPFKQYISEPAFDGKFPVIQQGNSPIMGYSSQNPCLDFDNTLVIGDHTMSVYYPKMPFLVASDGVKILKSLHLSGEFFYYFLLRYKPATEGYKRHFTILVEKLGFSPSIKDEESKISGFLSTIDNFISMAEREVSRLEKMKQASLQKMFPRPGATAPEIRFDGFTEPWQLKSLSELGSTFNGLSGKTKEDFGHGNARFITYMNVFSNPIANPAMVDAVEIDTCQTSVKYGDILFTTSSETPEEVGMSSVWEYSVPNVYLNSFCFGFRPTQIINLNYIAYFLRSPYFRTNMVVLAQGISRFNISKLKAMELPVLLPSDDEQKAIGEYFRNLDSLLSAKRQKLVKLRNIKQACLDKMFVNTSDL